MAKCVVIGGGFAGLSAAVHLLSKGHKVKLVEASPKLGGRAYSFKYDKQNDIVDNGQHILMGCYDYTIEFLKKINSLDKLEFQKNLSVTFVSRNGNQHKLDASRFFYPANLVYAMLRYKAVDLSDRIRILYLFIKIFLTSSKKYSNENTYSFLLKNKQTTNSIKYFWEIIHVGTMNCRLKDSSAEMFVNILRKMFFAGNKSSTIILPKKGLSETYCSNSEKFINNKGGEIFLSTKVVSIKTGDDGKLNSIVTDKGILTGFDFVIIAASPYNLKQLLSESGIEINIPNFNYSPILTCHIWLNENFFAKKFYGLIDSEIHWLFNHGKHITLVISAADELIDKNKEELINLFYDELERYFPYFKKESVMDFLILKEKRATFISDRDVINSRKLLNSKYANLVLAGDWANTALPSTIEGAVKSGKLASEIIS